MSVQRVLAKLASAKKSPKIKLSRNIFKLSLLISRTSTRLKTATFKPEVEVAKSLKRLALEEMRGRFLSDKSAKVSGAKLRRSKALEIVLIHHTPLIKQAFLGL